MLTARRPVCRTAAAVLILVTLLCAVASARETLPRRGILGASLANAEGGGVTVTAVLPSLPAAVAGLLAGDVVKSLDGAPVADVPDFLKKLRRPAGQPVALRIVRGKDAMNVRVVLAEAPKEHDSAVDTAYDAVDVDHSLRRTLVTTPHGVAGKHPAVLIVGGIGCYSVDVASNPEDAYLRLAHDLSKRGFVTMRLEKSGVGDSQGPPCSTVDYVTEAASYTVAFDALLADPHVDPAHVYVFGHSIGSVIAPRLALQKPVAGIVVAEGVGRDWFEYELINSRRQEELSGGTPAEVDADMLLKENCMHRLLVEKQDRDALLRATPECKDYVQYPAPPAYFQQIVAFNMAEPWSKLSIPVLAVYGSADFVTDEADHKRIVDVVNGAHPGRAKLTVIDGMDHYLIPAASQRASLERVQQPAGGAPPKYDERFSAAIASWLCEHERCTAPRSG
ncbi:MAG: alpha/beta fold hydrolase [Candidatus Eremiobacteraeota bacterium]|nr:alpha/beta fold hydrolase [Candidatus Eremiobacteraeota bacterium]